MGDRVIETIEALTAANREHRDGDVERRLVELRNAAFDRLDRTTGLASWPPAATGPDPIGVGIPEIQPGELTADAIRSGIVGHGALIVRGLVPPARVTRLVADIDRAFAARDKFFAGAAPIDTAPWYVPFEPQSGSASIGPIRNWVREGGGVLTAESPRSMFDLLDTFDEAGLAAPLRGYLGERPVLSAKKCTLRRVPLDITADWHQDGAFLGDGIRVVNVWIALTHCGDTAPGLDIIGGRLGELVPTGTEGAWFDWSVGDAVARAMERDLPVVRPIFEPGDAILFDELNLHRTAITPDMTHERYAIESWFFAPSHFPDTQIPLVF